MYCVLVVFLPSSSYMHTHTYNNYKIIIFLNNLINIIYIIIILSRNCTSEMLVIPHCLSNTSSQVLVFPNTYHLSLVTGFFEHIGLVTGLTFICGPTSFFLSTWYLFFNQLNILFRHMDSWQKELCFHWLESIPGRLSC